MTYLRSAMQRNKSLLTLHFTVFIWGFTGILGALISIPATYLVWYRVLIAFLSIYIWFRIKRTSLKVDQSSFVKLFLTGLILGGHWILFFYSIKISTVSVTLVSLSSITLFTSILEPLINRSRIAKLEVLIGCFIIGGIYLIFKFEHQYTLGILTGLASALSASVFSIINSKQVKTIQPAIISFYELFGAWCWLTLYFLFTGGFNSSMLLNEKDLFFLLVLGILCTAVAYVAGVSVMKELSAFRVALITNLEPIYGIIIAFLIFGKKEQMSTGFYAGTVLIIGSIFLYPYLRKQLRK
ncbi:DMT family transporter [Desertivirga brevis]|uniref:DMT family transporter n=1 Tax=Desertivirga brevis TaxID=2810310 RepID=UPI001F60F6DD|nr:DMT family transporter [Pedobacter sp. SYSU D00873]